MKNRCKIAALLLFSTIGLFSCSKNEDLGTSNIVIPSAERNVLDKWIFESLTLPLNIEVKYLWDESEFDLSKKLTPPNLKSVQPFLEVVRKVWIEPYTDVNIVPDQSFLKKYCPKQLVLSGSPNYNTDGTVTLGTAEGGRKIVLYEVDNFDSKNMEMVTGMLHTMQHEFAHILHQNKMYPAEFKKVTTGYTSTWYNFQDSESNLDGFITSYARSAEDEDFVEMVATMLTMSKADFDAKINSISSESGKKALRIKEGYVVTYFREKYNIDIYKLQKRIVGAMKSLNTPTTPAPLGLVTNYGA